MRGRFGVALMLVPCLLWGGIITNGSFESASVDPGGWFITLHTGSTAITGWTVLGHSIDYIGGYWQASDGNRSLDLDGSGVGGIEQTFTTVPGLAYWVWFDLAGNPVGGLPTKVLRVQVAGGAWQDYSFDITGKTLQNMGWVTHRFDFVAAGTSTTLQFLSQTPLGGPCCFGPALDNVRVEAIPEPEAFMLMGGGLLALGLLRRRRQLAPTTG